MARLGHIKRKGVVTRTEFLEMCRWKSPRGIARCQRNSPATIRRVSRTVLRTKDERERLRLLTSLKGVGIPRASAILTLIDPRRYGVIDIRAWGVLRALGVVTGNHRGQRFTARQWEQYLNALRDQARRLRISVRAVEHTLFQKHRAITRQLNLILYDKLTSKPVAAFLQRPND
jgi:hypothetical protein